MTSGSFTATIEGLICGHRQAPESQTQYVNSNSNDVVQKYLVICSQVFILSLKAREQNERKHNPVYILIHAHVWVYEMLNDRWKVFLSVFFSPEKCKVAFCLSSPSFLLMWAHGALLSLQDNTERKTWEGRLVRVNCTSGGQEWG